MRRIPAPRLPRPARRPNRAEAGSKDIAALEVRRLFGLTDLLLRDGPLETTLKATADAVMTVRGIRGAAILLPEGERLTRAVGAGEEFSPGELDDVASPVHRPVPVGLAAPAGEKVQVRVVALVAAGRPVGLLVIRGLPRTGIERESLMAFANHAAIAIERSLLRAEALRTEVLERTDRMRQALLATVAHDLCGPLATMKVATSGLYAAPLRDSAALEREADRDELCGLLESQIDHVSHLVNGLLDLSRCQAGVLAVDLAPHSISDLVQSAIALAGPTWEEGRVRTHIPELPLARADALLIRQVLVNLLDNANRYGPPGTPITVAARAERTRLEVSVADHGPGISAQQQAAVFDPFERQGEGGRAGLGLAIAKAFIDAHQHRIWVDDRVTAGARFVFSLSTAT